MPTFNSCLLCSPSRTTILNYAETSHLVWIKKSSTSAKVYQKLLFQKPAYLEASQFVNIYKNSYTTEFHAPRCFVLSPRKLQNSQKNDFNQHWELKDLLNISQMQYIILPCVSVWDLFNANRISSWHVTLERRCYRVCDVRIILGCSL